MWIYIVVGILILGILGFRKYKSAVGMALLKIQISSFDGKEYYVKIDKLDSEVVPIEYVRVVLNFACRNVIYYTPIRS